MTPSFAEMVTAIRAAVRIEVRVIEKLGLCEWPAVAEEMDAIRKRVALLAAAGEALARQIPYEAQLRTDPLEAFPSWTPDISQAGYGSIVLVRGVLVSNLFTGDCELRIQRGKRLSERLVVDHSAIVGTAKGAIPDVRDHPWLDEYGQPALEPAI